MSEDTEKKTNMLVRLLGLSCGDINIPPSPELIPQLLLKCSALGEKSWGIILFTLYITIAKQGDPSIIIIPPPMIGRIKNICVIDWKTLELEGYNLTEHIGYRAQYTTTTEFLGGKQYNIYTPSAVAIAIEYTDTTGDLITTGYILARTNEHLEPLGVSDTMPYTLAIIPPQTKLMQTIKQKCGIPEQREPEPKQYLIEAINKQKTYLYEQIEEPTIENETEDETEEEEEEIL